MARLKGIIKLQGTLDDLTFYKTQDGHLVKTKSSISKERIANDDAFIRTRENGSEFGSAASAGKLLRIAVKGMLSTSNAHFTSRVTKLMMLLRTADISSDRGNRNVHDAMGTAAGMDLIRGFNFNSNAQLDSVFLRNYTLDKVTGTLSILDLDPSTDFVRPKGATYARLNTAWAKIDFKKNIFEISYSTPLDFQFTKGDPLGPTDFLIPKKPVTPGISLFIMSVEFMQVVNGVIYNLNNGSYNACAIIDSAVAV